MVFPWSVPTSDQQPTHTPQLPGDGEGVDGNEKNGEIDGETDQKNEQDAMVAVEAEEEEEEEEKEEGEEVEGKQERKNGRKGGRKGRKGRRRRGGGEGRKRYTEPLNIAVDPGLSCAELG